MATSGAAKDQNIGQSGGQRGEISEVSGTGRVGDGNQGTLSAYSDIPKVLTPFYSELPNWTDIRHFSTVSNYILGMDFYGLATDGKRTVLYVVRNASDTTPLCVIQAAHKGDLWFKSLQWSHTLCSADEGFSETEICALYSDERRSEILGGISSDAIHGVDSKELYRITKPKPSSEDTAFRITDVDDVTKVIAVLSPTASQQRVQVKIVEQVDHIARVLFIICALRFYPKIATKTVLPPTYLRDSRTKAVLEALIQRDNFPVTETQASSQQRTMLQPVQSRNTPRETTSTTAPTSTFTAGPSGVRPITNLSTAGRVPTTVPTCIGPRPFGVPLTKSLVVGLKQPPMAPQSSAPTYTTSIFRFPRSAPGVPSSMAPQRTVPTCIGPRPLGVPLTQSLVVGLKQPPMAPQSSAPTYTTSIFRFPRSAPGVPSSTAPERTVGTSITAPMQTTATTTTETSAPTFSKSTPPKSTTLLDSPIRATDHSTPIRSMGTDDYGGESDESYPSGPKSSPREEANYSYGWDSSGWETIPSGQTPESTPRGRQGSPREQESFESQSYSPGWGSSGWETMSKSGSPESRYASSPSGTPSRTGAPSTVTAPTGGATRSVPEDFASTGSIGHLDAYNALTIHHIAFTLFGGIAFHSAVKTADGKKALYLMHHNTRTDIFELTDIPSSALLATAEPVQYNLTAIFAHKQGIATLIGYIYGQSIYNKDREKEIDGLKVRVSPEESRYVFRSVATEAERQAAPAGVLVGIPSHKRVFLQTADDIDHVMKVKLLFFARLFYFEMYQPLVGEVPELKTLQDLAQAPENLPPIQFRPIGGRDFTESLAIRRIEESQPPAEQAERAEQPGEISGGVEEAARQPEEEPLEPREQSEETVKRSDSGDDAEGSVEGREKVECSEENIEQAESPAQQEESSEPTVERKKHMDVTGSIASLMSTNYIVIDRVGEIKEENRDFYHIIDGYTEKVMHCVDNAVAPEQMLAIIDTEPPSDVALRLTNLMERAEVHISSGEIGVLEADNIICHATNERIKAQRYASGGKYFVIEGRSLRVPGRAMISLEPATKRITIQMGRGFELNWRALVLAYALKQNYVTYKSHTLNIKPEVSGIGEVIAAAQDINSKVPTQRNF